MRTPLKIVIAWIWVVVLCVSVLLAAAALGTDGWTPTRVHVERPVVVPQASAQPASAAGVRLGAHGTP